MDDLSKLGLKYGTDKIGKHNYLPIYYDLFKDRRNEVKKVLEIGVAEGAGLFMFRDFFPNSTIYGAEIDKERVDKLQGLERIEVYELDQSKEYELDFLTKLIGFDFDLIIDDGSHKPEDQLSTCKELFSTLDEGSIYIIEDVADDSVFSKLPTHWNRGLKRVGTRYDDQLIICRK